MSVESSYTRRSQPCEDKGNSSRSRGNSGSSLMARNNLEYLGIRIFFFPLLLEGVERDEAQRLNILL